MLNFRKRRYRQEASQLYDAIVAAARKPFFYTSLGVPDTLDGRFDLVSLYGFLVVDRLAREQPPGAELAQAVFDAMFRAMEVTLRELGVSDPSLARRMRSMWNAFHGRSLAYKDGLVAGGTSVLAAALARNIWRGHPPDGAPIALARLMHAEVEHLAAQPLADLTHGTVRFLALDAASDAPRSMRSSLP